MSEQMNLPLHEAILLLALKDREGTIIPMTEYLYAIGGAILAELVLSERLDLEGDKGGEVVAVRSSNLTGNAQLDECLQDIVSEQTPETAATWIKRFAGIRNLKNRMAESLVEKGILRSSEKKILRIFKRKVFPELNAGPERRCIAQLRRTVFSGEPVQDPRTIILLSLIKNTNLMQSVFTDDELRVHFQRIERVINTEITGETQEAITAVKAAFQVTHIIPGLLASSSSRS